MSDSPLARDSSGYLTESRGYNPPTMPTLSAAQVAAIAHEANRVYARGLTPPDFSHLHWDVAPDYQRDKIRAGVETHLSSSKSLSPKQAHEAWLKHMKAEGWTYGRVKNEDTRHHPCIVPYEDLPEDQRLKDEIFCAIVRALAPFTRDPEPA